MNKVYQILFLLSIALFVSCEKDDGPKAEPLRDFSEQYATDLDSIDRFIDTHYLTVDSNFNVTMTKIPTGGTQQSIRTQTEFPLEFKMVNKHDIDYKVYYLKIREGVNERPSRVDSVLVAYRGNLVNDTQFELAQNPVWFTLDNVIQGWSEIVPLFKTGTYETSEGPNPVTFADYGVGVMFLPSGLAYYNQVTGAVPRYSPLIFTFNLYELNYRDHDNDGILSKDEVANPGDNPLDYDSDNDGIPNMYDKDDDNDSYLTRFEISENGVVIFPYPTCPSELPKHLDASCH
ncbi:MAG: FKBP-type peptidylprolyl isomerase [Flavobacterium sp.]|nr:FKBP-type peptidylprolyl isomerase [Flavobacterium sp.]